CLTTFRVRRLWLARKVHVQRLFRYLPTFASFLAVFGAAPRNLQDSAAGIHRALVQPASPVSSVTPSDVTRATLENGMKVVVIRDPLAPVVTVEQNYLVGGNESRSEEHTSELQSPCNLVCRLLLEKKKSLSHG